LHLPSTLKEARDPRIEEHPTNDPRPWFETSQRSLREWFCSASKPVGHEHKGSPDEFTAMFVCPFEKWVMSKALALPRLFDACVEPDTH